VPVARHTQTGFASGEIDPLLAAREDLEQYYSAAARIDEGIALPQGPVRRRPGIFVADTPSGPNAATTAAVVPGGLHEIRHATLGDFVVILRNEEAELWRMSATTATTVAREDTPYSESESQTVRSIPVDGGLLLLHPDHPPATLVVAGTAQTPTITHADVDFESVPRFGYDDTTNAGVREIQTLRLEHLDAGAQIVIEYEGNPSQPVPGGESEVNTRRDIRQAVAEALDLRNDRGQIDDGFVAVSSSTNNATIDVTLLARPQTLLVAKVLRDTPSEETTTIAEFVRTRRGRRAMEPLWSATRGYPTTGAYYQGRLWLAGFRDAPDVVVASRSGRTGDFEADDEPIASSPLLIQAATEEAVRIEHLYAGRDLFLFCDRAELYIPQRPVTPANVSVQIASRYGISTPPVTVQDAPVYVDADGGHVRWFVWSEEVDNYTSPALTALASHLLEGVPVQLARARSVDAETPERLVVINADGTGAQATIGTEGRSAWSRMNTAGRQWRSVIGLSDGSFLFRTAQEIDFRRSDQIQRMDHADRSGLDSQLAIRLGGALRSWTRIPSFYQGRECIIIDAQTGREVWRGLPTSATQPIPNTGRSPTLHLAGLPITCRVEMLPFRGQGEESPTMRQQRIFRALVGLDRTQAQTFLSTGGDEGAHDERSLVAIERYDRARTDQTAPPSFTGIRRIVGLSGWSYGPRLTIEAEGAGAWALRNVTYDVRF